MISFGRFLGIDYGTKRIGVAISDENGTLAFPKEIILNNSSTFKRFSEILKAENVSEIVVGESLDFDGKENKVMQEVKEFIAQITQMFSLPVYLEKEFLTSVEARRFHEGIDRTDASAAALILQRYLDRKNKK
jgi:putative Holliday junction resolvase